MTDAQKLAAEYVNTRTKMAWRCAQGHRWEANLHCVKYKKSWCPTCSGRPKLTLADCQKLAESRRTQVGGDTEKHEEQEDLVPDLRQKKENPDNE